MEDEVCILIRKIRVTKDRKKKGKISFLSEEKKFGTVIGIGEEEDG